MVNTDNRQHIRSIARRIKKKISHPHGHGSQEFWISLDYR
jgi:hypothetical protein